MVMDERRKLGSEGTPMTRALACEAVVVEVQRRQRGQLSQFRRYGACAD